MAMETNPDPRYNSHFNGYGYYHNYFKFFMASIELLPW